MLRRCSPGIVLVSTMLSIVLVMMLVSSVVYSNMGGMRLSAAFSQREAALMAAQSGISYAIWRLRHNNGWVGAPELEPEEEGEEKEPFQPPKGMEVYEAGGNVLGKMATANGQPLFFRLKFNYEDGQGGLDKLPNSQGVGPIRSRYVSCNNLLHTTPTRLYPADVTGVLESWVERDQKWSRIEWDRVSARDYAASYPVPKATAVLIAEGFAGEDLRDLTLAEVATLQEGVDFPEGGSAPRLARRVVEVYLQLDFSTSEVNAVAYAAGDLVLMGEKLRTRAEGGAQSADLYVEQGLNLLVDKVDIDAGSAIHHGGTPIIADSKGNKVSARDVPLQPLQAGGESLVQAISWSQVRKAAPGAPTLPSGYYVWKRVLPSGEAKGDEAWDDKQNVLFYYPTAKAYEENRLNTEDYRWDGSQNANGALVVNPRDAAMTFTGDVRIVPQGGCQEFAVLYEPGAFKWAPRPVVGFQSPEGGKQPILTFGDDSGGQGGNIDIKGAVLGGGVISATGDITFQGPSVLEADPGIGPSIYAMGDVTLEGITSQSSAAERTHPSDASSGGGDGPNYALGFTLEGESDHWHAEFDGHQVVGEGATQSAWDAVESTIAEIYYEVHSDGRSSTYNVRDLATVKQEIYNDLLEIYKGYMQEAAQNFSSWGWLEPEASLENLKKFTPKPEEILRVFYEGLGKPGKLEDGEITIIRRDGDDSEETKIDAEGVAGAFCDRLPRLARNYEDLYKELYAAYHNGGDGGGQDSSDMTLLTDESTSEEMAKVEDMVPQDVVSQNYLLQKTNYLNHLLNTWGSVGYADQDIAGTIYAQGNIKIEIGMGSKLKLTGTMIAYGNDPQTGDPGQGDKFLTSPQGDTLPSGSITMVAKKLDLTTDPLYTMALLQDTPQMGVRRTMYAIY